MDSYNKVTLWKGLAKAGLQQYKSPYSTWLDVYQ